MFARPPPTKKRSVGVFFRALDDFVTAKRVAKSKRRAQKEIFVVFEMSNEKKRYFEAEILKSHLSSKLNDYASRIDFKATFLHNNSYIFLLQE